MDYTLVYTQRALNDLAEIIGHVAEEDGEAAAHFGISLLEHVDLLARFRMGGALRKRARVRKLIHSPILIYYQVDENEHEVADDSASGEVVQR